MPKITEINTQDGQHKMYVRFDGIVEIVLPLEDWVKFARNVLVSANTYLTLAVESATPDMSGADALREKAMINKIKCPECGLQLTSEAQEQALHSYNVEGFTGPVELACPRCEIELIITPEWSPTWFSVTKRAAQLT